MTYEMGQLLELDDGTQAVFKRRDGHHMMVMVLINKKMAYDLFVKPTRVVGVLESQPGYKNYYRKCIINGYIDEDN